MISVSDASTASDMGDKLSMARPKHSISHYGISLNIGGISLVMCRELTLNRQKCQEQFSSLRQVPQQLGTLAHL